VTIEKNGDRGSNLAVKIAPSVSLYRDKLKRLREAGGLPLKTDSPTNSTLKTDSPPNSTLKTDSPPNSIKRDVMCSASSNDLMFF